MANSILTSHYPTTSNTILLSLSWPNGASANSILATHDADYGGAPPPDTQPDALNFGSAVTGATRSLSYESPEATITGITAAAAFTFNGIGEWRRYTSGAWGGWNSAGSGSCVVNDKLQLRHTSSASYSTGTSSTIVFTSGSVTGTFTTTTLANPGVFEITGINLVGSTMTIYGALFGSKAIVAPHFFRSWVGAIAGLTWQQAGYTRSRTDNFTNSARTVTGQGLGGASAMKITCRQGVDGNTDDGVFTLPQLDLPANCTRIFFSQWMRFYCLEGAPIADDSHQVQIKGPRAGVFSGDGTHPENNYGTSPHMSASLFTCFSWANRDLSNLVAEFPGTGELSSWSQNMTPLPVGFAHNQYFNWEGAYILNDVGVANGVEWHRINGALTNLKTNIQNRTASGQHLDFLIPHPALENMSAGYAPKTRNWDVFFSRPYVDAGPDMLAGVFMGNASTIEACTGGRFRCPPSAWAADSVTVTDVESVPTGYDWVYLTKSDGSISNGWRWRGP